MKKTFFFIAFILFALTSRAQYMNYLHIDSDGVDGPGFESASDSFYSEYGVSFYLQSYAIYDCAALSGYEYSDGAYELVSQAEGYKDETRYESGGYTYRIYTQIYGYYTHAQLTARWN